MILWSPHSVIAGICSISPTPTLFAPPSPRHAETVKKFWQDLYDKGYCYKGSYEGWYCVREETYYNESDLLKNDEGEFVCPRLPSVLFRKLAAKKLVLQAFRIPGAVAEVLRGKP